MTQTAAASFTEGTSGEEQALWLIEINADQLDVDGGFTALRARLNDTGATAQLGSVLYILSDGRQTGATPKSAII